MAYLYALVVLALVFGILHYFTELTTRQKGAVALTLAFVIFAGYLYNTHSADEQEKILSVVKDFQNGKTLTCMGKDINSSNYTLSIGTYTFIGKENTPSSGDMVSASSCQ
ncbi:MAG: hypothetical protein PHX13_10635 [Thiovulaceae bacterium]|nr:hypothetical protein [Sulfurimonadaceae bacterium]